MKSILFLLCFTISLVAQAQPALTCKYWFDQQSLTTIQAIPYLSNQAVSINTGELPLGFHTVNMYFESEDGSRSSIISADFYKLSVEYGVTGVEYWFNDDIANKRNEIVNGLAEFSNGFDIATQDLPPGVHTISLRFLYQGGTWSSITTECFTKNTGVSGSSGIEYWFDENFQDRKALAANLDYFKNADLDLSELSVGFHSLHIRFKKQGGLWSQVSTGVFFKRSNAGTGLNSARGIRYWFDDEFLDKREAYIKGNSYSDILFSPIDAEHLTPGNHTIHLQVRDIFGLWSSPSSSLFENKLVEVKEIIQPKMTLSKSKVNVGEQLTLTIKDITSLGEIKLFLKRPSEQSLVISPENVIYSGENQDRCLVDIEINQNFKRGLYEISVLDVTAKKVTEISQFEVETVKTPTLKITGPQQNARVTNSEILISWIDVVDNAKPINSTGVIRKQFDIEYRSVAGGDWHLIYSGVTVFGKFINDKNYQFSRTVSLSELGQVEIRVTDHLSPENKSISDVFEIIEEHPILVRGDFEWDNSSNYRPSNRPIGLAADGASRIFVRLSRIDNSMSSKISRITATVENLDCCYSGESLECRVGRIFNLGKYDPQAQSASSTSVIDDVNTISDVWYVITAPDNYTTNSNDMSSKRKARVVFNIEFESLEIPDEIIEKEFEIVRPPLVLVHGLLGAASSFSKLRFRLNGGEFSFASENENQNLKLWPIPVKKIDYSATNNQDYLTNAKILLEVNTEPAELYNESLLSQLRLMRDKGYAANRIDYVGHSMGGLLPRTMINELSTYFNPSKLIGGVKFYFYDKGLINKLITITSPHNGSPISDFLQERFEKNDLVITQALKTNSLKGFVDRNEIAPAVRNLAFVNGGVRFPETKIRNHLIASSVSIDGTNNLFAIDKIGNGADKESRQLFALLEIWAISRWKETDFSSYLERKFNCTEFWRYSDLVVPLSSQLALPSITIPGEMRFDNIGNNNSTGSNSRSVVFSLGNEDMDKLTHLGILDNMDVGTRIMTLLNSSIHSSRFEDIIQRNKNPNRNLLGGNRFRQLDEFDLVDSIISYRDTNAVKILSPFSGSNNLMDSTILVSVELKDTVGYRGLFLMTDNEVYISRSRAPMQKFSIKASSGQVGTSGLKVLLVADSIGVFIQKWDTSQIELTASSNPESFRILPRSREINRNQWFDFIPQISFPGHLSRLKSNWDSIEITSSDTSVVRFDQVEKRFLSGDSGSAHMIFRYRNFLDTVYIYVSEKMIDNGRKPYCKGQTISFLAPVSPSATYQWQLVTDTGSVDLVDTGFYNGVSSSELSLVDPPSAVRSARYRCKVNSGNNSFFTSTFSIKPISVWTGAVDNDWFNGLNWSCLGVPDEFTDVVIPTGKPHFPHVGSAININSIKLESGSMITVGSGVQIEVKSLQ